MAGNDRSEIRSAAIAALATGATQEETAAACHRSPRTIRRWLADLQFRRDVDEARQRLFDEVLGRAMSHASKAADVLLGIVEDPEQPGSTRVSAARGLLQAALQYREQGELARRIAEIERSLAGQGGQAA